VLITNIDDCKVQIFLHLQAWNDRSERM